ncbi:hypothetical protein [Seleniivibrio woodruffii]|uniref:hypothetical protein n=1 Tax=Seleniivibrio woodruffii TaxID=1078050 RepID=UPI0026EE27F1|nr:hypothetical protein [Seleniivibrio woodruffii]
MMTFVCSEANMRLPVRYEQAPSSALLPAGSDLTVMSEKLDFMCMNTYCYVSAEYKIRSEKPQHLVMTFIGPAVQNITAVINSNKAIVSPQTVFEFKEFSAEFFGANFDESKLPDPQLCRETPTLKNVSGWKGFVLCTIKDNYIRNANMFFSEKTEPWKLYKIDFEAQIESGVNTVRVDYIQPYSYEEKWGGKGKYADHFKYVTYELWPLKEWKLADDFHMDISIKVSVQRHGFLKMKKNGFEVFGRNFSDAGFIDPRYNRDIQLTSGRKSGSAETIYESISFYRNMFPERLYIIFGDEKNLDDYKHTKSLMPMRTPLD